MNTPISARIEAEFLNPAFSMLDLAVIRRTILDAVRQVTPEFFGTVLDIGCGYKPYESLFLSPPSRATRYIGMDLADIKAQLDRIFAAGNRSSSREQAAGLRAALVEFKVGIGQLREALARSERDLETARREATDYARRGQLALGIEDHETVRIADEFTAKARARVDLLERKVIVQRDELAMAERDYEATREQFQAASRGMPLEAGSATDPTAGTDTMSSNDRIMLDHRAREATVEAQLAHLKKKLGDTK